MGSGKLLNKVINCWRCKTTRRKLKPFKNDLTGKIVENFWECIDYQKTGGKCEKKILKNYGSSK